MVKIWELDPGRALAQAAPPATTWWSSTPPPPATRSACSARRRRSARSRASARSPDRPSRCASCSRTRRAPPTWRSRRATEMAVTETLELQDGLHRAARPRARRGGRQRHAAAALLSARSSRGSRARRRDGPSRAGSATARGAELERGARRPRGPRARCTTRARFQHNQVARLRRRSFEVLGVPFVFAARARPCRRVRADRGEHARAEAVGGL